MEYALVPNRTAAEIKRAYYLRHKDIEEWRERRRYIARKYYEKNSFRINVIRRFRYGISRNLRELRNLEQPGNHPGPGNPEANLGAFGGN